MPEDLRAALRDLRADVRQDIDRAQDETNRRLDSITDHLQTLNGRVGSGEKEQARLGQAVVNVEREVFRRRRTDHKPSPDPTDEAKRSITERDVRMFVAGAVGVVGVVSFFWKLLPAVLKAVSP
jgi:hypothetical protein